MPLISKRNSLPDVARDEPASIALPLQWVGMCGIALPLRLADGTQLPASAEVAVDLPDPQAKGIHMSRLYLLLDAFASRSRLTPSAAHELLRQMRESHADCQSRAALLRLDFALLQQRAALVTPELAGWKSYPVTLTAQLRDSTLEIRLQVRIAYSSTCPCSPRTRTCRTSSSPPSRRSVARAASPGPSSAAPSPPTRARSSRRRSRTSRMPSRSSSSNASATLLTYDSSS